MFNSYPKGSLAWDCIEYEARPAMKTLDKGRQELEAAFDAMADQVDELSRENDELTEERDQLQSDYDEMKEDYEDLRDSFDVIGVIAKLNDLEEAAAAIVKYCVATRIKLRRFTNDEESVGAGGDGTGSDGAGESSCGSSS